jgi:hypothetical protein
MKKQIFYLGLTAILSATTLFTSCKKDKPKEDEETEVITTVELSFQDSANANAPILKYIWEDADGQGGNLPNKVDSIILDSAKTYNVDLRILDVSKNPVAIVSDEVKEEANDHEVYYNITPSGITVRVLDKDGNGLPLGLSSRWSVAKKQAQAKKNLNLVLKHKPGIKKDKDPVSVGETDIDVNLPIRLK